MSYSRVTKTLAVIAGLFLASCGFAHAQGIYYTSTIVSPDMDADTYGYSGSGGCGGLDFDSEFDDAWDYGSTPAWLYQSALATNGASYPWSIGMSGEIEGPYGCTSYSFTYNIGPVYINDATTGYTGGVPSGPSGCVYNSLACLPGTQAVCTSGLGITWLSSGCFPYGLAAEYVTVRYSSPTGSPLCFQKDSYEIGAAIACH